MPTRAQEPSLLRGDNVTLHTEGAGIVSVQLASGSLSGLSGSAAVSPWLLLPHLLLSTEDSVDSEDEFSLTLE